MALPCLEEYGGGMRTLDESRVCTRERSRRGAPGIQDAVDVARTRQEIRAARVIMDQVDDLNTARALEIPECCLEPRQERITEASEVIGVTRMGGGGNITQPAHPGV